MITAEMIRKVYDRINFQDHGPEGIAEGISEVFRCHLAELLAGEADLDRVIRAVARERAIRDTAAETGESREIVAEALDAAISMDHEAVLDLMEGEPTTLRSGLARYVQELEGRDELQPRDRIVDELGTLLAYPWPGEPDDWPDRCTCKGPRLPHSRGMAGCESEGS